MKKILLVLLAMFLLTMAEAQHKGQLVKWLKIAPKASVGTSFLVNSNTFSDKSIEASTINLSTSFGGSFGLGIGDYLEFYVEGNLAKFGQEYHLQVEKTDGTDQSYDKNLDFTAINTGIMMRYTSELGGYFEIGPSFTTLKTAEITNSTDGLAIDASEDFNSSYVNLSVGVGQAVYRSDRLFVFVGARFNFSPVSFYLPREAYSDATYFKDGMYNEQNLRYEPNTHSVQGKTMPMTGFLTLEINYIFGFWGNASCGRGRLLFFQ